MPTDLPYAAEAELSLTPEELRGLEEQYNQGQGEGHVAVQTKFNYAWGLIKSTRRSDQVQGVRLLQEIFRSEPNRRRECLYYLALGNYKMKNYEEAERFNGLLLDKEPNNMQALSLARLIEAKISRENQMALGITVGALAVGALMIGAIIRRATR